MLVQDISVGAGGANIGALSAGSGRLFFTAYDATHGQELWTSLGSNRSVSYTYDGLQRLTAANESPGTSYAYSYDDVGNRTGVWLNSTRVVTQTFNTANQVDGFTYDAAGNLSNDGSTTYGYDTLGRLIERGAAVYAYNGDGVLVVHSDASTTTRYTQDLASPLTQVLQTTAISTTNYLYGLDRLAAQGSYFKVRASGLCPSRSPLGA